MNKQYYTFQNFTETRLHNVFLHFVKFKKQKLYYSIRVKKLPTVFCFLALNYIFNTSS